MADTKLFISHDSALFYWRTNPPKYVLDGADNKVRALRGCPTSSEQVDGFVLSEAEFGPFPIDALIPPDTPRIRADSLLRYHEQKTQLPARTLIPIRDGIHVASPALCFVEMCKTLTFTEALELGMEFCGTYANREDQWEIIPTRDYQLESASSLLRKTANWHDIHGLVQARKVARFLADGSASPMETRLYLLLCLPRMRGGYNLSCPELNAELILPEKEQLMLGQRLVRPDFLWRKEKVILEYDGGYHNEQNQTIRDEKRRVLLEALGYTVFALKKQHICDALTLDELASTLAVKLGLRNRPLTLKQEYARESLRTALLGV